MKNPFELFDLPVEFTLDQAKLSECYLTLQRTLHPDNFVASSASEQRIAMQKSTEINDAQKILKDPILRAEAIIALNTGKVSDPETKNTRDVAFLMQQLEWREMLDKIETTRDEDELAHFSCQIDVEEKQILLDLAEALSQQQWQVADGLCDKLRFVKKLLTEIERVEDVIFES